MVLDPFEARNIQMMQGIIQGIRNDIAGNAVRAKDIQEFLQRIGVYIEVNPLWNTKYNDATMKFIEGTLQPMQKVLTGLPVGGSRVLFQEVAKQYTMSKVTKLGDDMKDQLRQITAKGLSEGKSHLQIAKDMDNKVASLGRSRAEAIAHTETHRAKNLGNYYKYREAGYKYFTVSYASDACKKCVAAFRGRVFHIDEVAFLPPFHPRCRCAAKFHREMPVGYKLYKAPKTADINQKQLSYQEISSTEGELFVKNRAGKDFKLTGDYKQFTFENGAGDNVLIAIDKNVKYAKWDKNQILKNYEDMPAILKTNVDNIVIRQYTRKQAGFYDHHTPKTINLVDRPEFTTLGRQRYVIKHESYHALENWDRLFPKSSKNPTANKIMKDWDNAMSADKAGNPYKKDSKYSYVSKNSYDHRRKGNYNEDRADSVAMYLEDTKAFTKDYPNRAAVLDKYLK